MAWYRVAYRPEVVTDLTKVAQAVAQRILDKTKWLASNVENLRHEPISADLPGLSKYAVSFGGEQVVPGHFFGRTGQFFGAFDASYRSTFSSSSTPSQYLNVQGYGVLNTRVGFRTSNAWTLSLWARNLLNKNYLDLMSAVAGNTGLLVAQPGDPRTFGVTLRLSLK